MFRDKLKLSKERLNKSLNFCNRKKENNRIDNENGKLAKRIIEKLPSINLTELNKEYKQSIKYKRLLLKLNKPQSKTKLHKSHKSSLSIETLNEHITKTKKRRKHNSKSYINKLNKFLNTSD